MARPFWGTIPWPISPTTGPRGAIRKSVRNTRERNTTLFPPSTRFCSTRTPRSMRRLMAAIAATRAEQLLRAIIDGTAAVTGDDFSRSLVRHLASALQLHYAFVAECLPNERARSLAFWQGGALGGNFEYHVARTPCLNVVAGQACVRTSRPPR